MDLAQADYLKNVLGIEQILCDSSELQSPDIRPVEPVSYNLEGNENAKCVFAVSSFLKGDEKNLFNKMVQAMKLNATNACVVYEIDWGKDFEGFLENFPQSKVVVVMSDNRVGEKEQMGQTQIHFTHHPKALLQNNELKKPAWAHLQEVMKCLS